tara:strand:+ start:972 stop:1157 length:186 start_codon:yes stop_codon:yes gene_type:complete
VPAIVFTTEKFKELTYATANSLGMPKARIMVVPHPLGGTEEETIIDWAESAVDGLVEILEV